VLVLVAAGYLIYHSFRNVISPPPPPGCRAGTGVQAIDLDPELFDALYNAGMAYSDWFDEAHGNDQKEKAREYLQKFVTNGGKSADGNYVKAANDKLYALSGP